MSPLSGVILSSAKLESSLLKFGGIGRDLLWIYCNAGIGVCKGSQLTPKLNLQDLRSKADRVQKEKYMEAARQMALRAPAKKLAITLLNQGWRIGAPQVSIGQYLPPHPHPNHVPSPYTIDIDYSTGPLSSRMDIIPPKLLIWPHSHVVRSRSGII